MRKRWTLFFFAALLAAALTSCSFQDEANIVADLAYGNGQSDHLVFLEENGVDVPFLVLSNLENGSSLLLRLYVLPGARRINDYSSYYENSEIDQYLNTEYLSQLDTMQSLIQSAEIEITDKAALGFSGRETMKITRKVFLLSCTEIGIDELQNEGEEGEVLSYFLEPGNRIALDETGTEASWWLRSPDTYYLSSSYGVGDNGIIGSGNSYQKNGIRPAFYVPSDTPVFTEGGTEGGAVYHKLKPGF